MAGLVGKAKRLKREGHFGEGDFKAIKIEVVDSGGDWKAVVVRPYAAAELVWSGVRIPA
jgi:hypothetical protein